MKQKENLALQYQMSLMVLFCSPLHLLICLFIQYLLVTSLFPFIAQNAVIQAESSAADEIKVIAMLSLIATMVNCCHIQLQM